MLLPLPPPLQCVFLPPSPYPLDHCSFPELWYAWGNLTWLSSLLPKLSPPLSPLLHSLTSDHSLFINLFLQSPGLTQHPLFRDTLSPSLFPLYICFGIWASVEFSFLFFNDLRRSRTFQFRNLLLQRTRGQPFTFMLVSTSPELAINERW